MELELEKKFRCPYCHEKISMVLDVSEEGEQQYIEDCEVCCQPIEIVYTVSNQKLVQFDCRAIQ